MSNYFPNAMSRFASALKQLCSPKARKVLRSFLCNISNSMSSFFRSRNGCVLFLCISLFVCLILTSAPNYAQQSQSDSYFVSSLASQIPAPLKVSIVIGFFLALACTAVILVEDVASANWLRALKIIFLDVTNKYSVIPVFGAILNIANLGVFVGVCIYLIWNLFAPFELGNQVGRVAYVCQGQYNLTTCRASYIKSLELALMALFSFLVTRLFIEYLVSRSLLLRQIRGRAQRDFPQNDGRG